MPVIAYYLYTKSMQRKALLIVFTILGLAVLALAAYGGYQYYQSHKEYVTPMVYPKLPPIDVNAPAPIVLKGPAPLIALSSSSLSVLDPSIGTTTYSFTLPMQVYSVVFEGQKGGSFSDLKIGTRIKYLPDPKDPTRVQYVAIARDPSLNAAPEEEASAVAGKVTKLTATTATIVASSSAPVEVTILPSTKIITTVRAGEVGRPLSVGETVSIYGTTTAKTFTARVILLELIPLKH